MLKTPKKVFWGEGLNAFSGGVRTLREGHRKKIQEKNRKKPQFTLNYQENKGFPVFSWSFFQEKGFGSLPGVFPLAHRLGSFVASATFDALAQQRRGSEEKL